MDINLMDEATMLGACQAASQYVQRGNPADDRNKTFRALIKNAIDKQRLSKDFAAYLVRFGAGGGYIHGAVEAYAISSDYHIAKVDMGIEMYKLLKCDDLLNQGI